MTGGTHGAGSPRRSAAGQAARTGREARVLVGHTPMEAQGGEGKGEAVGWA
jgi:hypothetical protein